MDNPLRHDPHAFAVARELLTAHHFVEDEILRKLGIGQSAELEDETDREQIEPWQETGTGVLVRLFLEGRYADRATAQDRLGTAGVQALHSLGLVADSGDQLYAPVAMFHTAGVWGISDRWNQPDRGWFHVREDIVYSSLVANAQRYLAFLPRRGCKSFLELCCGAGVAGLSAARYFAEEVHAYDIADRCVQFADFGRELNGLTNVTVRAGDLYEPAAGRKFDRIAVHPPYVPVLRPKYIYHDGGEDGEEIMRRACAGMVDHLNPGGMFYMVGMGSDRAGIPFEHRIRQWLGASQSDFDIAMISFWSLSPEELISKMVARSQDSQADRVQFRKLFASVHAERFVYGLTCVTRHTTQREAFTLRRQVGKETKPEDVGRLLDIEAQLKSPRAMIDLLGARVWPNKKTELNVVHTLTAQGWEPQNHILQTSSPFSMQANSDAWGAYLIAVCDGSQTVGELLKELQRQEVLPSGADPLEFAQAVSILISGGFLQLEQ